MGLNPLIIRAQLVRRLVSSQSAEGENRPPEHRKIGLHNPRYVDLNCEHHHQLSHQHHRGWIAAGSRELDFTKRSERTMTAHRGTDLS
jgi:hypothetical protein